jgi:4'-phosphopantetheinyl transferase EntD
VIDSILPPYVFSAEAYIDSIDTVLFPGEEAIIAGAVTARQREFATGRHCARTALARLGIAPAPILAGPRGNPAWPSGVAGSITHCPGYRAAAVARTANLASIGIDAEPDDPLPDGVLSLIATPDELNRMPTRRDQAGRLGRLLFSAKEAVYKAWFPLTRSWLGFEDAQIAFFDDGTFAATILAPGSLVKSTPLTRFEGRWLASEGLLLTAVTVLAEASGLLT